MSDKFSDFDYDEFNEMFSDGDDDSARHFEGKHMRDEYSHAPKHAAADNYGYDLDNFDEQRNTNMYSSVDEPIRESSSDYGDDFYAAPQADTDDRTMIYDETQREQISYDNMYAGRQQREQRQYEEEKKKNGALIAVIIITAVILVGLIIFLVVFLTSGKSGKTAETAPTATVATQAATEKATEKPTEVAKVEVPTQAPPTEAPVTPTEAPVTPTVVPVTPTEAPVTPTEAPDAPDGGDDTPSDIEVNTIPDDNNGNQ